MLALQFTGSVTHNVLSSGVVCTHPLGLIEPLSRIHQWALAFLSSRVPLGEEDVLASVTAHSFDDLSFWPQTVIPISNVTMLH